MKLIMRNVCFRWDASRPQMATGGGGPPKQTLFSIGIALKMASGTNPAGWIASHAESQ